MPYVKIPAVQNIFCDSNADQNREIIVEHRIGTDHDAESQLYGKLIMADLILSEQAIEFLFVFLVQNL